MADLYVSNEEPVKTLLLKDVEYPRFQRKKVWVKKPEKLFKFCISIFKGYPIGIFTFQKQYTDERTAWRLLDGRQRYTALSDMRNPENIWRWASATLKFNSKSDKKDIEDSFWEYVNEYIEYGEENINVDVEVNEDMSEGCHSESESLDLEVVSGNGSSHLKKIDELKKLIELITITHPVKSNKYCGITKPFLFEKYEGIEYISKDDSGKNPRIVFDDFRAWIDIQKIDRVEKITIDSILSWYPIQCRKNIELQVSQRLEGIKESLLCLKKLDNILENYKISFIELNSKCTDADAKKIFELINTGGTPLSAPEILSSKATWNADVPNATSMMKLNRDRLYDTIEDIEKPEDVVRWDVAATLTDRIPSGLDFLFGNWRNYKADDLDNKFTVGFKLMSGYYLGGISKSKMSELADEINADIVQWNLPEIEKTMEELSKALNHDKFFRMVSGWYKDKWNNSLMNMTTDAVAYNFFFNTAKDWKAKDKPSLGSKSYGEFIKNAIKLFDRSIYEYVTNAWAGSSDSKLTTNLNDQNYIGTSIDEKRWADLIDEMINSLTILGNKYTDKFDKPRMKALLYYSYLLRGIERPDGDKIFEVDHIIPQNSFTEGSEYYKHMNAIYNLEFLPSSSNSIKKENPLSMVTDQRTVLDVEKYSDIKKDFFKNCSNPDDYENLIDIRKDIFTRTFTHYRKRTVDGRYKEYEDNL